MMEHSVDCNFPGRCVAASRERLRRGGRKIFFGACRGQRVRRTRPALSPSKRDAKRERWEYSGSNRIFKEQLPFSSRTFVVEGLACEVVSVQGIDYVENQSALVTTHEELALQSQVEPAVYR